jgi:small subunit ribosomal protein S16
MGKKRQPIFKVVAADVRSPRDGKYIEAIGSYNPKTDPAKVELKEDRILYWLECGAQPTTTVKNLLSENGILLKRELTKQGLSEKDIEAKMEEWQKLQELKKTGKKEKLAQKKQAKIDAEKKKLEEEKEAEAKAKAEEEKAVAEAEEKVEEEKAPEVKEDAASDEVSTEETKPETE